MIKKIENECDIRVLVGQPKDIPNELLNKLSNYFSLRKDIKCAYLACVQYPNVEESVRLLVGLDTSTDLIQIVREMETHLNKSITLVNKIDFVHAIDSAFKSYFSKIKPFYYKE